MEVGKIIRGLNAQMEKMAESSKGKVMILEGLLRLTGELDQLICFTGKKDVRSGVKAVVESLLDLEKVRIGSMERVVKILTTLDKEVNNEKENTENVHLLREGDGRTP